MYPLNISKSVPADAPAGTGGCITSEHVPTPPQDMEGLHCLSGGQQTHHSFTESDELHVVGCENSLLVALDESRLLSDQPQPILHKTRTPIYCMVLRTWLGGGDRKGQATLTASMMMGMALAFDASKMPCEKRKLCSATRPSSPLRVKRKPSSSLTNFNISLSTNR